ncbi:gamma-glutamyl-gamma-aminobutyrate hydrolase family protein [Pedobacter rhodius]|uniref:Gamma-glutamyl-gamma-aminobutyrate hydrolase family protein n=1 Tax=Pedobacter rhodius TaxID=3004098 RepID=A0ABT4L3D3_9SPHI|nr:gamma-glutamyl-gamma-aminobutyrate hydrolase family protein [Pedobacter sp. SJ11]MCZ4225481.1 gamma-glutamyl-gamma-aminobutyrate hydrolase family protein [Pedobacter sp. SJ11]
MSDRIIIGVTDCSKFDIYSNWVLSCNENVEVIQLGYKLNNFEAIKKCHGIVLTGGEDVHPKFYKLPEYYPYCYDDDVDEQRDEFEFKVLEYTEKNEIPVLGICRGMQVGNVFFGGTLIPDIPTWGKFDHSKMPDKIDRYHEIIVNPSSWLNRIVNTDKGLVNSNHHQSTDRTGKGLVVSAVSPDGITEAMERLNPTGKSFLLFIQWHPERLKDQQSPFSKNLHEAFINAIKTRIDGLQDFKR